MSATCLVLARFSITSPHSRTRDDFILAEQIALKADYQDRQTPEFPCFLLPAPSMLVTVLKPKYMACWFQNMRTYAKKSLAFFPVLGWMFAFSENIHLTRSNPVKDCQIIENSLNSLKNYSHPVPVSALRISQPTLCFKKIYFRYCIVLKVLDLLKRN